MTDHSDVRSEIRSYGRRMRELATEQPDATAIVAVSRSGDEQLLRWSEYDRWSDAVARSLATRGVDEKALVAFALPNGVEHFVVSAAIWKIGACALALPVDLPAAERHTLLEVARPGAVVGDWPEAGAIATSEIRMAATAADAATPLPDRTARPARAVASGGSTGRPKIILLPGAMEGVPGDLGLLARLGGIAPRQTQLVAGPLYHNMPQGWAHLGLFHAHTVVVMERFDAALAVDLIERHRVSFAALVPTHLSRIAKLPGIADRDLSSLEAILHSAAVCPPWVKRAWIDLIGAERIYEGFGATEAIGYCAIRGDEWLEHPGSVGRPIDCDLRILDENGREVPPGEVGEVFMRRRDRAQSYEYLGAPPARTTPDGFVSLGDLGWLDADGYLFVADRRVDLIISGGVNVYPAEVESALTEHPAVGDVAVIGLFDEDLGRRVHALVELRPGHAATAEELLDHCRVRLARPKVPRTIELVARLPRNDAGKIRRSELVRERAKG